MKHLNEFKIYEASNWWEEKLKDYELKHDYIKDILYDFFDEGEIRISADFKNRKFTKISKKQMLYYHNFISHIQSLYILAILVINQLRILSVIIKNYRNVYWH